MSLTPTDKALRLRALHDGARAFVIANAFDAGSAVLLTKLGFEALATSSGAAAGVLGRRDGELSRDEALAHARPTHSPSRPAAREPRPIATGSGSSAAPAAAAE